MKTTELISTISEEASAKPGRREYVALLDFYQEDPRYYSIGKVTDVVNGSKDWDAVLEAAIHNFGGTKDVNKVINLLMVRDGGEAEAQLFLGEDVQHNGVDAWYDVQNIRWDDEKSTLYLVSGEVRCTG